jgi:hypothetical protein
MTASMSAWGTRSYGQPILAMICLAACFAWYSRRGLNEVGFHHHRIPLRRSTVVFS